MAPYPTAIGIDLGTANTRVAVFRDGRSEMIPCDGQVHIPSFVAFDDVERTIGTAAKNQAPMNPQNTVFDVLRLVGRRFSDAELQADMKHFPFRVLDRSGKPVVQIEYRGETRMLTPEELLSMLLAKARRCAEDYLGTPISSAVIIIPPYFNMAQRQSIRDAAAVVNLEVFYLLSGPTAAAIDCAVSNRQTRESNLLVVDVGAGTTDVVLATVEDGIIEIKSTACDLHLGGEDFDNRVVNFLLGKFKRETGKDLSVNCRALLRLRLASERAKCQLSSQTRTRIEINTLFEGLDFAYPLSRANVEEVCQDLFRSTFEPIERVLRDAKFEKTKVDEVILIGGSCRIPKLRKMLSELFHGKELNGFLNPDETAARGAATMAAIYSSYDDKSTKTNEILLLDVAPLSLGFEGPGGIMIPMIRRNTTIPTKKVERFGTSKDNQLTFPVKVFEGERARTRDNNRIGAFEIPVPLGPRGVPCVDITFDLDYQGHINVTATEVNSGATRRLYILGSSNLSKEEIVRMMIEAEKYREDDEVQEARIAAKNSLESYAYSLRSGLSSRGTHISVSELSRLLEEALSWFEDNHYATAEEYKDWESQLQKASAKAQQEQEKRIQPTGAKKLSGQPKHGEDPKQRSPSDSDSYIDDYIPRADRYDPADSPDNPSDGNLHKDTTPYSGPHHPADEAGPSDSSGIRHKVEPSNLANDQPSENAAANMPSGQQHLDQASKSPSSTSNASTPLSAIAPDEDHSKRSSKSNKTRASDAQPKPQGLEGLFSTSDAETRQAFTDVEFGQMSMYLRNMGRPTWSTVPRLYAVLRMIGQLTMLDAFVEQGMTDIWFPFTNTSLPDVLPPSARASFLTTQSMVFSKSLRFEKSSDREHTNFGPNDPLPFEVIGKLGSGAHGHVDKVMSTVSHREYARKIFRKARGMRREEVRSFLTELQVLKRIRHIHCVELVSDSSLSTKKSAEGI
jgi:heat shock 70kDa protein 1/2/6/8